MADVVVENVARTEVVGVATGALDCCAALQMALHADRIARLGREFRRIYDGRAPRDVSFSRTVASLTTHALLGEWRRRVSVLGAV
jgi:hypothetical protein